MKRLVVILLTLTPLVMHSMEPEELTLAKGKLEGNEEKLPWPSFPAHIEKMIAKEFLAKGSIKRFILSQVSLDFEDCNYDSFYSAQVIPTGKCLSGSGDGTIMIFDSTTNDLLLTLRGHTAAFLSYEFNLARDKIVTCSEDATARIWDARTGAPLHILRGHTGAVTSAKFNRAGDKVVTESKDGSVRIWNIKSDALLLHSFRGEIGKFSRKVDKIVTTSEDGIARIWDVETGEFLRGLKYTNSKGLTVPLKSAEFNPVGDKVVTTSEDGFVRIWEVKTGELLRSLEYNLYGCAVCVESAEFNPAGDKVVADTYDSRARTLTRPFTRKVRIWDLQPLLLKEDSLLKTDITLEQAVILKTIIEVIKVRGIVKALGKEAFERGAPTLSPKEITFDFNSYTHLWDAYASLPKAIKEFFDLYVTKLSPCTEEQAPLKP